MKPNATLTLKFPHKTYTFPVEWKGAYFINGIEVAEQSFFSDAMEADFAQGGYPEMTVVLDSNPQVQSQCHFEDATGEIYPNRDVSSLP